MTTTTITEQMGWLTPVEARGGLLVKREDLYRADTGVNGAKYRACQHLIGEAVRGGATAVTTAASVLSPQHAIVATVARQFGVPSFHTVGATHPTAARRHESVRIAMGLGAHFDYIGCAYNASLQPAAARAADEIPGAYMLHYGITTPQSATPAEVRAFAEVGARQVENLPDGLRTIIVPFGSANSATGVLLGLSRLAHPPEVHLMGIGPDRRAWCRRRLEQIGADVSRLDVHHHDLTGRYRYSDKVKQSLGGVRLHPTYEAKIVRYLADETPDYAAPDSGALLWVVGGPLG